MTSVTLVVVLLFLICFSFHTKNHMQIYSFCIQRNVLKMPVPMTNVSSFNRVNICHTSWKVNDSNTPGMTIKKHSCKLWVLVIWYGIKWESCLEVWDTSHISNDFSHTNTNNSQNFHRKFCFEFPSKLNIDVSANSPNPPKLLVMHKFDCITVSTL